MSADDDDNDGDQLDDPAFLVHEFNSLLTVVLGNAERLRDLSEPSSEMRRLAEESLEAANRGITLTHRLLTVARGIDRTAVDDARPEALVSVGADAKEMATPAGSERKQRILLVEDDDLLRDFVVSVLESLEYRVVAAENGPHALALLDEYRDFDLLFTDVVMPGEFNGLDLVRQARQLMPELPVLLTSGHHDQLDTGNHADVYSIRKPYRRSELRDSLRQSLQSDRPDSAERDTRGD